MKLKYPLTDTHTFSIEEIVAAMDTDVEQGLTSTEADLRIKKFGLNIYESQKPKSIWLMLILQFKNPIVYLLLFATAVSLYFRHNIEALSILVVILINAIIGFLMELQARNSMKALKEMDIIYSRVRRDGKLLEVASERLVPGDILILEAGDVIPGDGRLIEEQELQCDESSLTGESLPVEKNTEMLSGDTVLAERSNMVYKGTSVTHGKGVVVLIGTAAHTQLGIITSLVDTFDKKETPLDKQIKVLSRYLIWITLGLTALFAISGILQGKSWILILKTSIALAVAAFPEGLPIVSTIALSYGMLLMARRNAIVKKLSAVETLGSTDIILTDKTGTLTENKVVVDSLVFGKDTLRISLTEDSLSFENEPGELLPSFHWLRLIGVLCNNARQEGEGEDVSLSGDPIEVALWHMALLSGTTAEELISPFTRVGEVPFSSETKMMATLHKSEEGYLISAKGSGEHIMEKCTHIRTIDGVRDLKEEEKTGILVTAEKLASEGLRVLGFAYKETRENTLEPHLDSLIYIGMVGFLDPPRMDVRESIMLCRKAGIKTIMITGDHPLTALNIAQKVGLVDASEENVITGKDIPQAESMTQKWKEKILSTSVFARTTPQQKLDIVTVYQEAGHIVAMTGDGINDAPALKKADIGIAMGIRGTQVAKETADIVLKDDSFASVERAVAHGRAIFANIRKFVVHLVSCNLSEILIVTSLGFIAPASTLLPLQILFLNMVTDIFPALALGLGKGDKGLMSRPPKSTDEHLVTGRNWRAVYAFSALITLSVIGAVLYTREVYEGSHIMANNVAFMTLSLAQIFHIFNMASSRSPIWVNEITKNIFAWSAIVICLLILAAVFAFPQMRMVLHLDILPSHLWGVSVIASLVPLLLVQSLKVWRKWTKK
jgi:Ca2+-transporting ATPase